MNKKMNKKYEIHIRLDIDNKEDFAIAEFLRHQYNVNQVTKDIIYQFIQKRQSVNAPLIVKRNDFDNQNADHDVSVQKSINSKNPKTKSKIEESNSSGKLTNVTNDEEMRKKEYDRYVHEEKPFDLTVDLFKKNSFE